MATHNGSDVECDVSNHHTRKLCVTCSDRDGKGDIYINVQSNGLPNHCYGDFENVREDVLLEFSVLFNRDVSEEAQNIRIGDINTITETSDILCGLDTMNPSNIPEEADYEANIPDKVADANPDRLLVKNPAFELTDRIVAVALDGMFIYSGGNDDEWDAVEAWMKNANSEDPVDECFATVTPQYETNGMENADYGVLHYHTASPCIFPVGVGLASNTTPDIWQENGNFVLGDSTSTARADNLAWIEQ